MTLLAEEATWANLQIELEEKLDQWHVPHPEDHAKVFIQGLRTTGWRTPLPDFDVRNESWKRRRPTRTEATQRRIAACRAAIRQAGRDE
jgi:hypothetical protein